jgi:hypothetical protein
VITLLLILSALIVGVLLASLLDIAVRRSVRAPAGGDAAEPTPRPGARPPRAFPAEVVALRLTSSGLVWLSPVDGRVMSRAARDRAARAVRRVITAANLACACAPDCDGRANATEYSPYMDDFCDDCTWTRCDVSGHPSHTDARLMSRAER